MIVGVATQHYLSPSLFGGKFNAVVDDRFLILFNGIDVRKTAEVGGRVFRVQTEFQDMDGSHKAGIYRYLTDEKGRVLTMRNERDEEVVQYEFVPGKVEIFLRLKEGELLDDIQRNTFKVARIKKHPADADPEAFAKQLAGTTNAGTWKQFHADFPGAGVAGDAPGAGGGVAAADGGSLYCQCDRYSVCTCHKLPNPVIDNRPRP